MLHAACMEEEIAGNMQVNWKSADRVVKNVGLFSSFNTCLSNGTAAWIAVAPEIYS
jgi:hypothetical protein